MSNLINGETKKKKQDNNFIMLRVLRCAVLFRNKILNCKDLCASFFGRGMGARGRLFLREHAASEL